MPLIRDTIDPTREREVSDAEAWHLEATGILLTGTRARTPEGLRAAAVRQVLQRQAEAVAAVAGPAARLVPVPVADEDEDGDAVEDGPGGGDDSKPPDSGQESGTGNASEDSSGDTDDSQES